MSNLPHVKFEAEKVSAKQMSNGEWQVTFRVSPDDFPSSVMMMTPGERMVIAVVPLDENDQPTATPKTHNKALPRYQDRPPSQQAAIRCSSPTFHNWLAETHRELWVRHRNLSANSGTDTTVVAPEIAAACCVRELAGVESRRDLTVEQWRKIEDAYLSDIGAQER